MTEPALRPSPAHAVRRLGLALWRNHKSLWQHVMRHWVAYALLLVGGVVASHYLGINFTDSVPERFVWLEHGALPSRDELIVLRFEASAGPAAALNGTRWLKRVRGLPGDRITVVGRNVYVNDQLIGAAIERTGRGSVLHPISAGTIPAGYYFIGGSSTGSLDSRYSEVGLVASGQVLARAHAFF